MKEKLHNHVYERVQLGIKEQLCHNISFDTLPVGCHKGEFAGG
jgi:hypothetical protein